MHVCGWLLHGAPGAPASAIGARGWQRALTRSLRTRRERAWRIEALRAPECLALVCLSYNCMPMQLYSLDF